MAHAAINVARYFLSIPDRESGELISNLKLQKLLYYAQGFYVAMKGVDKPLFAEKIYAWQHGPVVKAVYDHYSHRGSGAIPLVKEAPNLPEATTVFLDEIYRAYGRYSAWALREMTHKEAPWLDNYDPDVKNVEIPLSDLRAFFLPYVKKKKPK